MSKIIRLLGKALAPRRSQFAPILLSDAARCHGHRRVLRACSGTGIVPTFTPAKRTWLLQPLDARAYDDAQLDKGQRVLDTVSCIEI